MVNKIAQGGEMEHAVQRITHSKYFTPAFNAAIYDGPVRIYFAQMQESDALKIYSHLQGKIIKSNQELCSSLKQRGQNIFVLLYPTLDTFEHSFDQCHEGVPRIICEKLGQDFVVGISGPVEEPDYERIYLKLQSIMRQCDYSFSFV